MFRKKSPKGTDLFIIMSEHNSEQVNNSHLIKFTTNLNMTKSRYYYYLFDTKEWIQVELLNPLPYGLYTFQYENQEEEEGKCIVACLDSYRLKSEIPRETDHDEMLKQKQWRDSLTANSQFDFLTTDGEWKKGKVGWTKCDVVPGVLSICNRKGDNMYMMSGDVNGYYYKDSIGFEQPATHTCVITQEQLDMEAEEERKRIEWLANDKKKKVEWMKQYHEEFGSPMVGLSGMGDPLPYYQSLKKYPHEVTKQHLIDNVNDVEKKEIIKNAGENKSMPLTATVNNEFDEYDVFYENREDDITYEYNGKMMHSIPSKSDGYCDIKVHNATFAYLDVGKKFDFIKDGDYYVLPEITIDNPIFLPITGSPARIITDGNKVSYKSFFVRAKPLYILRQVTQHCSVIHINDGVVVHTRFITNEDLEYNVLGKKLREGKYLSDNELLIIGKYLEKYG